MLIYSTKLCARIEFKMSRQKLNYKRTNFYFPPEILSRVKALKDKTGDSMSSIIRKAIEKSLEEAGL